MVTEKTIKIQKNKILTYSVNKEGFKTVYGSVLVNENQNINVEMKNLNSQDEPFQLGDRLFGISSFVDYFTPSGTYDVDSLKYISAKQTTGSGLTNIAVVKDTWLSKVETELGIETPKGTSNNFIFTYNGSTWDITGALTLAGQSLEDFGISFEGTPTEGNVITVVETQYNRFAFFVLDANYRGNYAWDSNPSSTIMPKQYASNPQDCLETATFYNQYIFDNTNISQYSLFNHCKNLGTFILNNRIKITPLIPNGKELQLIWNNKAALDSFDPIIQEGTTTYNLTNWAFGHNDVWSCLEYDYKHSWYLDNSGNWHFDYYNNYSKSDTFGCVPIFEVPVM